MKSLYVFKTPIKKPLQTYNIIIINSIYINKLKLKLRQVTNFNNHYCFFTYKFKFKFINFHKIVWKIICYGYILRTQSRNVKRILTSKPKKIMITLAKLIIDIIFSIF